MAPSKQPPVEVANFQRTAFISWKEHSPRTSSEVFEIQGSVSVQNAMTTRSKAFAQQLLQRRPQSARHLESSHRKVTLKSASKRCQNAIRIRTHGYKYPTIPRKQSS
eukprot:2648630-Amphidinium_carterae.1